MLRITNDPVPNAASFVRLDDGSPLQADEFLLAYRLRGYEVQTSATAFYFQEGTARSTLARSLVCLSLRQTVRPCL